MHTHEADRRYPLKTTSNTAHLTTFRSPQKKESKKLSFDAYGASSLPVKSRRPMAYYYQDDVPPRPRSADM